MEYEIKATSTFRLNLKELWEYRELFYFFTWRDVKIKYKQTVLGVLWVVLQPLMMMVVFTVIGDALNVPHEEIPYPVFVYSGLLLWNLFSTGLTGAANSMVSNANIIKKIYFPRMIIPISSILVSLFDFISAFVVFIGLLIYFHQPVNILIILYLPLSLLITLLCTFGLGSFIAALSVKYRDFRYVVPFMVQLLFFLSPVIYPVNILHNEMLKTILSYNPMSGAIQLLRSCFTGVTPDWQAIGGGFAVALAMFFFGIFYFRKTEYYFADLA